MKTEEMITMKADNDVCAYCAYGGHCEWWCSGRCFQLSKRVEEALEVVKHIKETEYEYQWEEDDDYTRGYNSCLEEMKRLVGE